MMLSYLSKCLFLLILFELVEGKDMENFEVVKLRPSIFPNVPPYIHFHSPISVNKSSDDVRIFSTQFSFYGKPKLWSSAVRIIQNSGVQVTTRKLNWIGIWSQATKHRQRWKKFKQHQKLNHIPGTRELGDKARQWENVKRAIQKYGKSDFDFVPNGFILPMERNLFREAWKSSEGGDTKWWILKRPKGSKGKGMRVIDKWSQVPKSTKRISVQEYIKNPMLIEGYKFQLRLFVLVTSFNPLRAYQFNEGFTTCGVKKYSNDARDISNSLIHLTNVWTKEDNKKSFYDIHRLEHTWAEFLKLVEDGGGDIKSVQTKLDDAIIKTLVISHNSVIEAGSKYKNLNRYNSFGLFAVDFMMDENFHPWFLEVNRSPSVWVNESVISQMKMAVMEETLNIVGFHLPSSIRHQVKMNADHLLFDERLYTKFISPEERIKHKMFEKNLVPSKEILKNLTPDDVRYLVTAEDELSQCKNFKRIFPTKETESYFKYFEHPRYYDILMNEWEKTYGENRTLGIERLQKLCREKIHLKTATGASEAKLNKLLNIK